MWAGGFFGVVIVRGRNHEGGAVQRLIVGEGKSQDLGDPTKEVGATA